MNKDIPYIYDLLQELAWHFGNHGFNGECCEDLTLVEFMALKKLQQLNNITIQRLGDSLCFTKSGSSKLIDRLENKKYAIRETSPIDGRVCCVSITQAGRDIVSKITNNYSTYLGKVLDDFQPQQIKQIGDSLEMLASAIRKNKPFNANGGDCC